MNHRFYLFSILISLILICSLDAQNPHLPREPEKLISRAQSFWQFMVTGQRLKALDFVLPEKRDAFISNSPIPVLGAKVAGLNLTDDSSRAALRVQLTTMMTQAAASTAWTVTDTWVWKNGNWYVDVADPFKALGRTGGASPDAASVAKEIDSELRVPQPWLKIGRVVQGQDLRFQIPVDYTGKQPLLVETVSAPSSVSVTAEHGQVTSESKYLTLFFSTAEWEGNLSLPVRIRFRHEAASVERLVTLQADVFAPVTFRQLPKHSADPSGKISVFVRNNTSERIEFRYVSVDDKIEVIKDLDAIEPESEKEAIFKLKPGETPESLILYPRKPVQGIGLFSYRFRVER